MSTTPSTISLLIADDSERLRTHLKELLGLDETLTVVGEAADASEAVALTQEHRPTCAILDIQMPGNGIHALRAIKRAAPEVKVIMFSNHADAYFRRACFQAGADAFLDKSLEFEYIIPTIKRLV